MRTFLSTDYQTLEEAQTARQKTITLYLQTQNFDLSDYLEIYQRIS